MVQNILQQTLKTLKIKYKVMDYYAKDYFKKIQEGNVYDIAYQGVDTGSDPINWVIDMMWCTKMGVSFHDPIDSMCQLTQEYKSNTSAVIDEKYKTRFNQIIENDATVIPLFHRVRCI